MSSRSIVMTPSVSTNFPGYSLEHDKLDKCDGWARTGILIQNGIQYKRRPDLEEPGLSTVWLQVGVHGSKHFLVQATYRQFQRLGRTGSGTHPSQRARWDRILSNWERAILEDREIVTLGDMNIDSLLWDTPTENWAPYDKAKIPLYLMLRERILNTGTTKVNSEYTRSENQPGGRISCLDHIYTNHPEKINNHTTIHSTFSDHSMVILNKRVKKLESQRSYIKIRSMKNMNIPLYKENIENHNLFISTLYEPEPQVISTNITTMLQDSLKTMAPVVRNSTVTQESKTPKH